MNLQTVGHSPYTFLPSGILIVEPYEGLLCPANDDLHRKNNVQLGILGTELELR